MAEVKRQRQWNDNIGLDWTSKWYLFPAETVDGMNSVDIPLQSSDDAFVPGKFITVQCKRQSSDSNYPCENIATFGIRWLPSLTRTYVKLVWNTKRDKPKESAGSHDHAKALQGSTSTHYDPTERYVHEVEPHNCQILSG
jgi:hypothetical protein